MKAIQGPQGNRLSRVDGTWKGGIRVASPQSSPDGSLEGHTMGLFRSTPRHARAGRKPTQAERRAAERTAQAEARLEQTEQRIHDLADEVRGDLKDPARR